MICSFLTYWAGLLNEDLKRQVIQGVEALKTTALIFHKQDTQRQIQDERQLIQFVG
jgi:hypothetical protein